MRAAIVPSSIHRAALPSNANVYDCPAVSGAPVTNSTGAATTAKKKPAIPRHA